MNKYVISDIHGCNKTFRSLLERINFSKEDELYLLGDYVDRGPDSKGVIDTIIDLKEQGFQVKSLRGNHEQMLYDEHLNNVWPPGEEETLKSFGVDHNNAIPKSYINWIVQLEHYFEVDNYILVHGGLNFISENPLADKEDMLWMRGWYERINKTWLGDRIIIHGHTPIQQNYIEQMIENLTELPVINIDNGCVYDEDGFRQLCCLNLKNRELLFERNIDGYYKKNVI